MTAKKASPLTSAAESAVASLPAAPDLPFGEALEQLEAVVGQLEGDAALDLDQALALYERGVALAAACRNRLSLAELRLTEITAATMANPAETHE